MYYRRIADFVGMLSKVIPYKLGAFGKKRFLSSKIKNFPSNFKRIDHGTDSTNGRWSLHDLAGKIESRRGLEIPVYVVGSYESTDEVLDNIDELKEEATETGWLIFDKKEQEWQWVVD